MIGGKSFIDNVRAGNVGSAIVDVAGIVVDAADSIPFFVRSATLGDIVRVERRDGKLWFESSLTRSKNSLIRVVFLDQDSVEFVKGSLLAMGCSAEYLRNYNLMAINIPISTSLVEVQNYLRAEAYAGRIDFEESILSQ